MTGKMKWLFSILGVSLILNVFALGLFVGKGARIVVPTDRERMTPPPADFNFKRLEHNLPMDQREKVRKLIREKSRELRQGYGALREAEQHIKKIVLAETVDADALREALVKHSELSRGLHDPMRWIMLETIAGLDLETRKKLINDMFRGPRTKRLRSGPSLHRRPHPEGHRPPPREDRRCDDCDGET